MILELERTKLEQELHRIKNRIYLLKQVAKALEGLIEYDKKVAARTNT